VKAKIGIIAAILVIGLVFFSYAANKDITETGMNVTATGTTEGISLHFSNIPENAVLLSVSLLDITENDQIGASFHIRDDEMANSYKLTELKESGNLVLPFVKPEHEYMITVHLRIGSMDNYDSEEYSVNNVIAGGGIYMTNRPSLRFTNDNSSLTLSEMPEFSGEVSYSQGSYRQQGIFYYSISVYTDEKTGYSDGDWSNELTFDSVFQMIDNIKQDFGNDVEFAGDLPVHAHVYCALKYGNMERTILIAKTEDVIFSFLEKQ